jgi:hypothetical protein
MKSNSCICIPCFIAGGHKHHKAFLSIGGGACDCGNMQFWRPSGNCPQHPGPDADHDQTQIDTKSRAKLYTVLLAAGNALVRSMNVTGHNFRIIMAELQSFLPLGDGVRRIVARIFTDEIDHRQFLEGLSRINEESAELLKTFIGSLVNDHYFISHFADKYYDIFPDLLRQIITGGQSPFSNEKSPPLVGLLSLLENCFHFLSDHPINAALLSHTLDWRRLYLTIIETQLAFMRDSGDSSAVSRIWHVFRNSSAVSRLAKFGGRDCAELAVCPNFLQTLAVTLKEKRRRTLASTRTSTPPTGCQSHLLGQFVDR